MSRNAFISWYKMFVRLESVFEAAPDDAAGRALKASFVYARTGEVPELDPVANILFSSIRPSIDESAGTFENISARNRENGKKGGRPTKHSTPETQNNPENPNNPEKAEVRSKKIEDRSKKIEDNRVRRTATPSSARAKPPTEDEAIEFFTANGSTAQEAKSYFDYYSANGWKVGKNSMKDWKAAARNWIHRAGEYSNTSSKQPISKAEVSANAYTQATAVLNNYRR